MIYSLFFLVLFVIDGQVKLSPMGEAPSFAPCSNKYTECEIWKKVKLCESEVYRDYMSFNCPVSCKICKGLPEESKAERQVPVNFLKNIVNSDSILNKTIASTNDINNFGKQSAATLKINNNGDKRIKILENKQVNTSSNSPIKMMYNNSGVVVMTEVGSGSVGDTKIDFFHNKKNISSNKNSKKEYGDKNEERHKKSSLPLPSKSKRISTEQKTTPKKNKQLIESKPSGDLKDEPTPSTPAPDASVADPSSADDLKAEPTPSTPAPNTSVDDPNGYGDTTIQETLPEIFTTTPEPSSQETITESPVTETPPPQEQEELYVTEPLLEVPEKSARKFRLVIKEKFCTSLNDKNSPKYKILQGNVVKAITKYIGDDAEVDSIELSGNCNPKKKDHYIKVTFTVHSSHWTIKRFRRLFSTGKIDGLSVVSDSLIEILDK